MHFKKTIQDMKTTVLANEGFFNARIIQENPGKPVRIISVRMLADIPFIQVMDNQEFHLDN